jgi:hypothetical protein
MLIGISIPSSETHPHLPNSRKKHLPRLMCHPMALKKINAGFYMVGKVLEGEQ